MNIEIVMLHEGSFYVAKEGGKCTECPMEAGCDLLVKFQGDVDQVCRAINQQNNWTGRVCKWVKQ